MADAPSTRGGRGLGRLKAAVVATGLLGAGAVFFLWPSSSDDARRDATVTADPAAAPLPIVEVGPSGRPDIERLPEVPSGTMLVNGARVQTLRVGLPLYVEYLITNPLGTPLSLSAASLDPPTITGGAPVALAFDLVAPPTDVPAGGDARVTWISNSAPSPGRYRVTWSPPAAWLGDVETPVIRAARVTIVDEPADPLEAEIAQLRLLGVRGEWGSALSRIDEMLATDPDNLPLSVARVDTLEAIGRHADAYEALLDAAALLERRRELDYPGEESVVPFSLEARLATLDRAAHDENDANAEPEPEPQPQ